MRALRVRYTALIEDKGSKEQGFLYRVIVLIWGKELRTVTKCNTHRHMSRTQAHRITALFPHILTAQCTHVHTYLLG